MHTRPVVEQAFPLVEQAEARGRVETTSPAEKEAAA